MITPFRTETFPLDKTSRPIRTSASNQDNSGSTAMLPRVLMVYRHHASSLVYYPAMLGKAGFAVDVLTVASHPVRYSRHVANRLKAGNSDEAFRAALEKCILADAYHFLLFADEESRRIGYSLPAHPQYDKLLPIPRENPLSCAVDDKIQFQAWCRQHGLPIAITHIAEDSDHAVQMAGLLGYPVILKGSVGVGGKAVHICKDELSLREAHAKLAPCGQPMVQEFITGPVGSITFCSQRGRMGAWFSGEKQLALKKGLGPTAVRHTRKDPALGQLALKVAALGEITGITGFDWMEKAPGCFVIIDPHCGRCTPTAVTGHYSGVQIGKAFRRLLEGDNHIEHPSRDSERVAIFPLIVEVIFQGRFLELLRAAPLFFKKSYYFFGPLDECVLTFVLGFQYIVSGLRVVFGRMRLKLTSFIRPRRLPPATDMLERV